MTICAVLSDIHGNYAALESVFKDAKKFASSLKQDIFFISLGDVVDYGADSNQCVDWVQQTTEIAIPGNHDLAILVCRHKHFEYQQSMLPGLVSPHLWPMTLWTSFSLEDAQIKAIQQWEEKEKEELVITASVLPDFALFHSSLDPMFTDKGIRDSISAKYNFETLRNLLLPYGLCGHTHHQGYFAPFQNDNEQTFDFWACPTSNISLRGNGRKVVPLDKWIPLPKEVIINPGSVGLTRQDSLFSKAGEKKPACYALLKLGTDGQVSDMMFRQSAYNWRSMIQSLHNVHWKNTGSQHTIKLLEYAIEKNEDYYHAGNYPEIGQIYQALHNGQAIEGLNQLTRQFIAREILPQIDPHIKKEGHNTIMRQI